MIHGDFTGLAEDYSRYRPDYSPEVLKAIIGLVGKRVSEIDAVDVGAGTGIWSRMVAQVGVRSIVAVEPNVDMRKQGKANPNNGEIQWKDGSGEDTELVSNCADLVTMASSFHWVDFEKGLHEFHRILRQAGCFVALWNPRFIEVNPLLVEIESYLAHLKGGEIKRVSSGRSKFTEGLTDKLEQSAQFSAVTYLESKHILTFSSEGYIGAWRSVNDLRVQLGQEKFNSFLDWVTHRIADLEIIEATYLTRAWVARKSP